MVVRKVSKIKNVGIYRDFQWNDDLPSFDEFNLIYGWNYSGKTTLSRIFDVLDDPKHLASLGGSFEIEDENGRAIQSASISLSENCKVFNRPFIERNFKEEHNAPAVFIVGDDANKIRERIAVLQHHKSRIERFAHSLSIQKTEWERRVNDGLKRNQARAIAELVSDRVFDKRHLDILLKRVKNSPDDHILDPTEFAAVKATANSAEEFSVLTQFKIPEFDIFDLAEHVDRLLSQTASNNAIERLKNDPNLEAWVRRGRELHAEGDTCGFCGHRIETDRLDRLRGHFSQEYEALVRSIQDKATELGELQIDAVLPDVSRLIPEVRITYKKAVSTIGAYSQLANKVAPLLIELLEQKTKGIETAQQLSEEVRSFLADAEPYSYSAVHKEVNAILQAHNNQISDFETTKKRARDKLKLHSAARFYLDDNIAQEETEYEKIQEQQRRADTIGASIDAKIAVLEGEIKLHSVAVGRLNDLIGIILSGSNINAVQLSENEFEFRRGTERAVNLSDGERTAIAFAYFILTLEDGGNDLGNTIVFVDDPISSLDSNHIYAVYALIGDKLRGKCKQLFVSTHNYEFFNLLKDDALNSNRNFRQGCSGVLTRRSYDEHGEPYAELMKMPAALRKYRSEYQFIFALLYQFSSSPDATLHEAYTSPTILRKFLEAYLGFRKPAGGSWSNKLELLFDDPVERKEVSKFVDDASHMQSFRNVAEHAQYIASAKEMIKKILEALEQKDPIHYSGLRSLVDG